MHDQGGAVAVGGGLVVSRTGVRGRNRRWGVFHLLLEVSVQTSHKIQNLATRPYAPENPLEGLVQA